MKKIVSGTDMKKVDRYTIDHIGIPSMVLMERAALSVFEQIKANESQSKSVIVAASTGNNGADGLAIARMLFLAGYDTCVYILGEQRKCSEEFKRQKRICESLKIPFIKAFENRDIVVDAIFGVGLSRDVSDVYEEVILKINNNKNRIYSVDIPSGVDADTGKIRGVGVKADYTVTFGSHKIGTVLYPGAEYCGNVIVSDIGFPNRAFDEVQAYYYLTEDDLSIIPPRPNYSNKGTFGKILIIAGSKDISGAAYLSAKAALKCGAGMVRILTAKENKEVIQKLLPEAMVNVYDTDNVDERIITSALAWSDIVAIGPGLGIGEVQKKIIEYVIVSDKPTVIDADGLNNISEEEHLKKMLHKNIIITPHLAEMSRLMDAEVKYIAKDLISYAKRAHQKYMADCVLKDARTVIASGEHIFINLTGNSGMATAGSGDVLTGIIAGLIGIGVAFQNAAALGAYIHGFAGDLAAEHKGKHSLMASDIIDELENVLK